MERESKTYRCFDVKVKFKYPQTLDEFNMKLDLKKKLTVVLTVCSCHVTYTFGSEWLPECQGNPCSKQARNLKVK